MLTFHPLSIAKPANLLPVAHSSVSAGFPSPADDYLGTQLDLNDYLIKHPEATFLVRVSGDSMLQAGIFAGDLLVVDRSLVAASGDVVIAVVEREFLVKKFLSLGQQIILRSANSKYADVILSANLENDEYQRDSFEIWGVVTYCLHALKNN